VSERREEGKERGRKGRRKGRAGGRALQLSKSRVRRILTTIAYEERKCERIESTGEQRRSKASRASSDRERIST